MNCIHCEQPFEIDEPVVLKGYWSLDGLVGKPKNTPSEFLLLAGVSEEEFEANSKLEYLHGACLFQMYDDVKEEWVI
tara:strand:+ start:494 stop:724 length:231 start_codon:yes stop_codon:yes gene_type:complete